MFNAIVFLLLHSRPVFRSKLHFTNPAIIMHTMCMMAPAKLTLVICQLSFVEQTLNAIFSFCCFA